MKNLKTPLRYPGGKSRAAKMLVGKFPTGIEEFREPFLGGGSVAIEFTKQNPETPVWVNDKYYYLYNFWVQLQERGEDLCEALLAIKSEAHTVERAKEVFLLAKAVIADRDEFQQAVYFYVLNKCSFSGLTENSSFSGQASNSNFSVRSIKKLPQFSEMIQHWHITNVDYSRLLLDDYGNGESTFCFLDPPYDIKDFLYGGKGGTMHKGFDHQMFAETCKKSPHNWLITYNSNENTRALFESYNLTEWDFTYTMRSTGSYNVDQSKRKELMVTNYKNLSPIEELLDEQTAVPPR
tara:strand:- start:1023 stop:1904 length:882 start_codon:yes stop_codon:yes gene_type:complete